MKEAKGYVPPKPYDYPNSMPYISGGKVNLTIKGNNMQAVIYGRPNCPYCDSAKALAGREGIDYTYIDIRAAGIDGEKLSEMLGRPVRTVPQILVDGEYVGGFTEFEAKLKELKEKKPEVSMDNLDIDNINFGDLDQAATRNQERMEEADEAAAAVIPDNDCKDGCAV